ncbi:MAG TPA: hypothetical protein PLG59_07645 [bacterium]|nr:hypothetical protein [bacterium]
MVILRYCDDCYDEGYRSRVMNEEDFLQWLSKQEQQYHPNAYRFVLEALKHAQRRYDRLRHVTGRELLEGISELARKEFGPFALTVLTEWGVTNTRDFGAIVFQLVETGEIKKTEEDRIEDFVGVYEFAQEFGNVQLGDPIHTEV